MVLPRLAGWKLSANKLIRTFEFQDFVESLSFINSLVAYFETIDHHPDVRIAYGEVTFEHRYDVGGKVTDRDVEVAKKISSQYHSRSRDKTPSSPRAYSGGGIRLHSAASIREPLTPESARSESGSTVRTHVDHLQRAVIST